MSAFHSLFSKNLSKSLAGFQLNLFLFCLRLSLIPSLFHSIGFGGQSQTNGFLVCSSSCTRPEIVESLATLVASIHVQNQGAEGSPIFSSQKLPDILKSQMSALGITDLSQSEIAQVYTTVLLQSTAWGTYLNNRSEQALQMLNGMGIQAEDILNLQGFLRKNTEATEEERSAVFSRSPEALKRVILAGGSTLNDLGGDFSDVREDGSSSADDVHRQLLGLFNDPEEVFFVGKTMNIRYSRDPAIVGEYLRKLSRINFSKVPASGVCEILESFLEYFTDEIFLGEEEDKAALKKVQSAFSANSAAVSKLLDVPTEYKSFQCRQHTLDGLSRELKTSVDKVGGASRLPPKEPLSLREDVSKIGCSMTEIQKQLQDDLRNYRGGVVRAFKDSLGCTTSIVIIPMTPKTTKKWVDKFPKGQVPSQIPKLYIYLTFSSKLGEPGFQELYSY